MNTQKLVRIAYDGARNLLEIDFTGDIGVAEIQDSESELGKILATVRPDFLLLCDFTELNSMDVLCAPAIRRTMDRFAGHGVKRVVRIIPNRRKDIGFNIMSLFHYPRSVQILLCRTRAEANEALA